jgi:hypothetical protein
MEPPRWTKYPSDKLAAALAQRLPAEVEVGEFDIFNEHGLPVGEGCDVQ